MNRVAIGYVRVSSEQQAAEGVSLESQRSKIRAYCEIHDLELREICADEGLSGKRADNRPGLQIALNLTCKYQAVLIVYSLSRLARSVRDCIDISERIQKCGAAMASLTERLDTTTAAGEFYFHLMSALAQMERRQISERTKAALQYKKRCGEFTGGLPYGYRLADDGNKLEPIIEQQAAIGIMLSMRKDAMPFQHIANELNSAGIPTQRGGPWKRDTIYRILQRRIA